MPISKITLSGETRDMIAFSFDILPMKRFEGVPTTYHFALPKSEAVRFAQGLLQALGETDPNKGTEH